MPKEIFPFSKEVCKASYGLNCGTCKKCCSNPPALMFDEVYKYRHYLTPCLHLDFSPLSFFLSGFPASLHEEALAQFKKRYILFSEKEKDGKPAGESGTFVFMPILAIDDFNADGMCCMFQQGKCRLEDDKPLRCRALPLEGDMPECMLIDNLQYVQKKYHCKGLKIHPEPAEQRIASLFMLTEKSTAKRISEKPARPFMTGRQRRSLSRAGIARRQHSGHHGLD